MWYWIIGFFFFLASLTTIHVFNNLSDDPKEKIANDGSWAIVLFLCLVAGVGWLPLLILGVIGGIVVVIFHGCKVIALLIIKRFKLIKPKE